MRLYLYVHMCSVCVYMIYVNFENKNEVYCHNITTLKPHLRLRIQLTGHGYHCGHGYGYGYG